MITKLKSSINKFIHIESSSGVVLFVAALFALLLANSGFSTGYNSFLSAKIINLSISHWINDGLMAIFFFLVGLEIKKEIVIGELNSVKKASLPVAAALGGMVVPALIYLLFNPKPPVSTGWGIPMATDIAFALGVLSLFGQRIPAVLKILLLAVAIVDDLGAIVVIAVFYTSKLNAMGTAIGVVAVLAIQLLKHFKISNYFVYIPFGILLWFGVLYSGVHATIAGVILGLLTPIQFKTNNAKQIKPVETLIKFLHAPVSFLIMPAFALANAGVELSIDLLQSGSSTGLFKGILFGLVLGKPLGIVLFSFFCYKFKFAHLPKGISWRHIFVLGNIAGIGFTMSLFISKLALSTDLDQIAKLAILVASSLAMLIGVVSALLLVPKRSI